MKFSIIRGPFNKGVNIVNKAVNPKVAIPALSNILVKTEEGQIKMTASDLQVTISIWTNANIEQPGETTIPAKLLQSFIGQINEDKVDCSVADGKFHVQTEKITSTFTTLPASEFPDIEVIEEGDHVKLKSEDLVRALQHIQFVPGVNESRPVLTGIYIMISKDQMTLAVTDGFRMAEYKIKLDKDYGFESSCIVPSRSFTDIVKSFSSENEYVEMFINNNRNVVNLRVKDMQAQLRMIEGEYPDYRAIIPSEFNTKVLIAKSEVSNAIKLASVFSKDQDNMVKMVANADLVEVRSQPTESGSNIIKVQGEFTGTPIEIAFNAKYLIDLVSNAEGDEISFEANDPLKPAAFKVTGNDDYLYIVMPMRASW